MPYALITGASKCIGKAIAFQLAARQKNLLLVARDEGKLRDVCSEAENKFGVKTHFLALDLSSPGAAKTVFEWCRDQQYEIDVLVNNAGYGLSGSFEKYSLEEHLNMIQLNMNVVVELTYYFLAPLKQQPKSYILNVASSAAYQAVPFLSVYAASKAFVLQFSRGLQYELSKTSVSVTCVSPGATDTAFVERAQIGAKGLELARKFNMRPEDVASIAVTAMYKGKTEVITGVMNKIGAALAWLLPKKMIEKASAKIYQ